jgi:hypothetical protein
MRLISALLFASSALLAVNASAQVRIYCCNDANGTKVCGDYPPDACRGRPGEERDAKGIVTRQIEAPLTEEQQARREAELARKEDAKKKAGEERRRTLALLSTYANEKDINSARDRALAEVEKNMKQSQARLEEANKKKAKLDAEKEFYKGKAMPDSLKAQIRENEKEVKAQAAAVDDRVKDMEDIRNRFGEERKRYLELTGGKSTQEKLRQDQAQDTAHKEFLYSESERLRKAKESREISADEDRANVRALEADDEKRNRADRAAKVEKAAPRSQDRSNRDVLNEVRERKSSESLATEAEKIKRSQVK